MRTTIVSTSVKVPTWLVAARNGRLELKDDGTYRLTPFGTHHARQIGSRTTACGLFAVDWKLFWDQTFTGLREAECPECREVLASPSRKSHGTATQG
jgi:hypothetical protein